jgi:alpha-beta hydrolase superfamily lysophospholipase
MLASPSRRRRTFVNCLSGLVGAVALLGAGCSSSTGAPAARSTSDDVRFTGCDKVACSGVLDGAKYEIRLPQKWNGTLLVYSHGYRQAKPAPPDFGPVDTDPQVAATDEVAGQLLAKGYALAGSAYASNGWAVADGVKSGEQLRDFFAAKVGKPDRIYVWGDSLGGLITETLAEKHPDWIDGAAPMCGVLGGSNLNLDLALDVGYAVRTLIYPALKIVGYGSYEDAVGNFQRAHNAVLAATKDVSNGVPKLLLIGAIVDGPTQTERYDGSTPAGQVAATVESIVTALGYGTFGRYEIEQRVGGNPSGNAGADYGRRVSAAERGLIDTVSAGATDRDLALLAGGERVSPDPAARAKFDQLGNPSGDLQVPTITLHTKADPLVLVQNETVFADRVKHSRKRTADLVQLYTVAPPTYTPPAPYGAGHCNFTTEERVGIVGLLDGWVRRGTYPGPGAITGAFAGDKGLSPAFRPGPWPATAAG